MTSGQNAATAGRWRGDRAAWLVAAIVLLAAVLRVALADYSLWYDEYASLFFARRTLGELWGPWMVRETNPPLFYTLLKGWLALGFHSRTEIRLLPIAAGVLQVALLATICWRWFGRPAAMVVAILAALAPASIYFSHLVRGYIFASDGALVGLLGLLLALDTPGRDNGRDNGGRRRIWPWALYVAGCTVGIYCHSTMVIWPMAVGLALAIALVARLERIDAPFVAEFVAANVAILLLSAWWLHISYEQLQGGLQNLSWNKPVGPREFVRLVLGSCFLSIEPYDRDKIVTTLLPLLTLGTIVWLRRDPKVRLLALLFAATLLIFGVLGAFKPIVIQRTLYWISIFPLIIVATGLGRLPDARWRWLGVAAIALLLLNNLRVHYPEYQAQDWDQALGRLAADPASIALFQNNSMAEVVGEACRLHFGSPHCPFRVRQVGTSRHDPERAGDDWRRTVAELRQALQPTDRVYALRSFDYDPFTALGVAEDALPAGWHERLLQGPLPPQAVVPASTK